MRVPGRGVHPESLLAGGGCWHGGGWSGARGNGWESGCALALTHPSDVAAAACSAPTGGNRGPSPNSGARRRQSRQQSPAAPGPVLGGGGPVGVASP